LLPPSGFGRTGGESFRRAARQSEAIFSALKPNLVGDLHFGFQSLVELRVGSLRDVQCYIALFERWGYVPCANADYEPGFLKIAIYALDDSFQHVAKQLRGGGWSSKAVPFMTSGTNPLKHSVHQGLCAMRARSSS
jgi:hypothetical protein